MSGDSYSPATPSAMSLHEKSFLAPPVCGGDGRRAQIGNALVVCQSHMGHHGRLFPSIHNQKKGLADYFQYKTWQSQEDKSRAFGRDLKSSLLVSVASPPWRPSSLVCSAPPACDIACGLQSTFRYGFGTWAPASLLGLADLVTTCWRD